MAARAVGAAHAEFAGDWFREAHRGVDSLRNFRSRKDLDAYRRELLERSEPQAEFIRKHVDPPRRLFELGAGNGRVPICPGSAGSQACGRRIDVSESKIFIRRADGRVDDGRREYLPLHTDGELDPILQAAGFDLEASVDGFRGDDLDTR